MIWKLFKKLKPKLWWVEEHRFGSGVVYRPEGNPNGCINIYGPFNSREEAQEYYSKHFGILG